MYWTQLLVEIDKVIADRVKSGNLDKISISLPDGQGTLAYERLDSLIKYRDIVAQRAQAENGKPSIFARVSVYA